VSLSDRSDESLLQYYESIRTQVEADRQSMRSEQAYGFARSAAIKAYAATIADELARRHLHFTPIEWLPERGNPSGLAPHEKSATRADAGGA
jgi:hypothetical protein